MTERDTISKIEALVVRKETRELNELSYRVVKDPNNVVLRKVLVDEKNRLDPNEKIDHEEYFVQTGKYTQGRK